MTRTLTSHDVRRWGEHAGGSPLYAHLVEVIASDDELMRILNQIDHDPRPNVLFAGVQYLLMKEEGQHELSRHYPNLSEETYSIEDVDTPFREFVNAHEGELVDIGRTRHTQTNECRRCAALVAAIWEGPLFSFHLVDLGTSAGLNLLMDRYHYRWNGLEWGPSSHVELECEIRGRPPVPRHIEVLSRTGLDLNPLDLANPDDRMWLEALIWPEQSDRRQRLSAAAEIYQETEVEMIAGDALDTLYPTLNSLPDEEPVVVMHSFALNQLTPDQRDAMSVVLSTAREERPVWRVSMELLDWSDDAPKLTIDDGSGPSVIGEAQPHGEWLDLYARP